MKTTITVLVTLLLTFGAYLQAENETKPKTKLEEFAAKPNEVIVEGYETIGSIDGEFDTKVSVEVNEYTNASNKKVVYGIGIKIEDLSKEGFATAWVDEEEIDALIVGIEFLVAHKGENSSLSEWEMVYHTPGGVDFLVDPCGVMLEVYPEKPFTAFFDMEKMEELGKLVVKAKARIEVAKKMR